MIPEEIARRERLENLRQAGHNPYPAEAHRSHQIKDVLSAFESLEKSKEQVFIVGRVRSLRKHGGLTFLTLEDASERVQLALKRDNLGIEDYNFFHENIDIGDFLEVSGPVFLTKKGQQSVDVLTWRLLTKALLPLPEKWHGLTDTEKRYRWRYLDLLANPEVVANARARAKIVQTMRNFLEGAGFMEVETPILQPLAGGAAARPFVTHHNTLHHDFYLRIAPELYLKRLIVGGFEKIFEFARCFRNEGISPQHNPEFTQIETYWAYATIEDLMEHLEQMLEQVALAIHGQTEIPAGNQTLSFKTPLPRKTFHDLIQSETNIDLDQITSEEALAEEIKKLGLETEGHIGYAELVDHLWKSKVRPKIEQPTFVVDYPSEMKPLAKKRKNPRYSASAQLVVRGMELTNAFNEQNDPLEQEEQFGEQEELRERGSEEAQSVDEDFLKALKHGMPPTAGYGIGIDRLTALMLDAPNLKEVILFPTLKPTHYDEAEEDSDLRDV